MAVLDHLLQSKSNGGGPAPQEQNEMHALVLAKAPDPVQAKGIRGGTSKTVSQEQYEVQGSEGSTSSTGSSRRKGPNASDSKKPKKARKMRRSETSMPRDTEVHETLSADSYDKFREQAGGDTHR